MEPDWMKKIPNETICDWFYIFFWLYVGVTSLIVLLLIYIAFAKIPLGMKWPMAIGNVLSLIAWTIHTLFVYLICDRGLLGATAKKEGFAQPKRTWYGTLSRR